MRITIDLLFVFAISFVFGFAAWTASRLYDDEKVMKQNAHAIELLQKQAATP